MSAPDNLDQNESMCDSEEFALDLLRDAADTARALIGNLPNASADALSKYPIVAMTYALLVQRDHRAEEQYSLGRAIIEGLQAIKESVDLLAARSHSADPSNEPQLGQTQTLSDYARLKELMELARPAFTAAQYEEAIIRLRRLAGV